PRNTRKTRKEEKRIGLFFLSCLSCISWWPSTVLLWLRRRHVAIARRETGPALPGRSRTHDPPVDTGRPRRLFVRRPGRGASPAVPLAARAGIDLPRLADHRG